MKKVFFPLMLFSFTTIQAQKVIVSDPNAQARKVSGFHAIKVSNAIDLQLSQSNEEAVAVSAAKDEYRDRIKTEVDNGVLKIWYQNESRWWKNSGNKKLKAYVSFRSIEKISASGACDVVVTGVIRSDKLDIDLSGASDFRGAIHGGTSNINLSGASDAIIIGTISNLKVDASGASEFQAYDLRTENCNAEASGASSIKVTVNKELNAHASGASSIFYKGAGVIREIKTGGASSVARKS